MQLGDQALHEKERRQIAGYAIDENRRGRRHPWQIVPQKGGNGGRMAFIVGKKYVDGFLEVGERGIRCGKIPHMPTNTEVRAQADKKRFIRGRPIWSKLREFGSLPQAVPVRPIVDGDNFPAAVFEHGLRH